MTFPGLGGQQPPPPNAPPALTPLPGITPGVPTLLTVTQLVVVPGGRLEGIFTYSSNPPAAGTLIASASVEAAGTDAYGNHFLAGTASYNNGSGIASALTAGAATFYTGTLAGGWVPQSSIVGLGSSGMELNAVSGSITLNTNSIGGALSIPQSPTPGFPISGSATLATVITDVNNLQSQLVGAGIIS